MFGNIEIEKNILPQKDFCHFKGRRYRESISFCQDSLW